ncbi:MAG: MFS transporter [Ignavibacteria bacterium]|nr:MFS transporter [Ignavibacteria bacterium]
MESWKKNLYVLWGTQFLTMMGMNLVVPFLPFYIRQLGITDQNELARWSGMVFAAPFLTAFIATPFWGSMGDKHGRKLMVVRALFGLSFAQILIGFAQNPLQLLLFRLFQGLISGFIAAALALVSTSTPKNRIGYALGFLQSASAGGVMLGPAVGGFLADLLGYREIFFIAAGVCVIGGFVVIKLVHEVEIPKENGLKPTIFQNYALMTKDPQLRLIGLTILLSQSAALMIEPIFALFIEGFKAETKYLSTLTGIIFSIAGVFMVISAPWWGNRNDRIGFKRNLTIALTGTGVAYSLHIIVPNLYLLGLLRAALGFVRGGILHALFSMTNLRSPARRQSGLIGIASSLAVLGNMLGPLAGGFIAGHFGTTAVFTVNSTIFILMSFIIWKYLAELPKHQTVELQEAVGVPK